MADPLIVGVGNTRFGRLESAGPIELMAEAAASALADAGLERGSVDGLLCGYATTLPHLMLSDLFAERFGLSPTYAHGMQLGGATGAAMLMLAGDLVRAGRCRTVLVVAGEDRLSGQSRDQSIHTLAQVGHAEFEVRNGASVPAYYALLASRYMHETGTTEDGLAELAVLMRAHAGLHEDAHLRGPITAADVLASRPIATPLKFLDCCPISDGAVAMIVSADTGAGARVRMAGEGQAHHHQHVSAMRDVRQTGAASSVERAFAQAGRRLVDVDYLAIYDSFTITLAMLLEEIGIVPPGSAGAAARDGMFGPAGRFPLNLHGGLLSFGHSGVAGGLAHAAEAVRQLRGVAGARQVPDASCALIHGDGGVLSAHVSIVLERAA